MRMALVATSGLGGLALASLALAAPALTPANSIPFPFVANTEETFVGSGCGTPSVVVRTLPAGATGVLDVEPVVGGRDDRGLTRVTAVTVSGAVVTISVIADGQSICAPDGTGAPPSQPIPWTATYSFHAEYTRRVQPKLRMYYESYIVPRITRWQVRPRSIQLNRANLPRVQRERVTGITWKSFGGRTAVGFSTLRQDWCPPGDKCHGNGERVRLVATKPAYCGDPLSQQIEYQDLSLYFDGRLQRGIPLRCG